MIGISLATLLSCASETRRPANIIANSRFLIDGPEQIIEGRENWRGPDDLSAECFITREKDGFHIRIVITDDDFQAQSQSPTQNDSAAIYLDFRNNDRRESDSFSRGAFMVRLMPHFAGDLGESMRWYPLDKSYDPSVPGTKFTSKTLNPKQYEIKIHLPIEGLKQSQTVPMREFFIDVEIIDADASGGITRMSWTGKDRNWELP
ncbi:MAG: sugar-binding protein [bacterium]